MMSAAARDSRIRSGRCPPRSPWVSVRSQTWCPASAWRTQKAAASDLHVVGVRADREHDGRSRAAAAGAREQGGDGLHQFGRTDGLGQEGVRAAAQRVDRVVEALVAGEDDERDLGVKALGAARELEAAGVGKLDVGEHDVERAARELLGRRGSVGGDDHLAAAGVLERRAGELGGRRVVLDHQCDGGVALFGRLHAAKVRSGGLALLTRRSRNGQEAPARAA